MSQVWFYFIHNNVVPAFYSRQDSVADLDLSFKRTQVSGRESTQEEED